MTRQDIGGKSFEDFLPADVAYIMIARLFVDHIDRGSFFTKFIGDALAYALCTAGDDDYFVFESVHHCLETIAETDREIGVALLACHHLILDFGEGSEILIERIANACAKVGQHLVAVVTL